MTASSPSPSPEGKLIRWARTASGLKIHEAAERTGWAVSATRWSQIETGREIRKGNRRQARASDRTLVHMAKAVGVTPEQLEEAGRTDAAAILRESLQRDRVAEEPQPSTPPESSAGAPVGYPEGLPQRPEYWRLWAAADLGSGENQILQDDLEAAIFIVDEMRKRRLRSAAQDPGAAGPGHSATG